MRVSEQDLGTANAALKDAIVLGDYDDAWIRFQKVYKQYCTDRKLPMLEDMKFILRNMLNVSAVT